MEDIQEKDIKIYMDSPKKITENTIIYGKIKSKSSETKIRGIYYAISHGMPYIGKLYSKSEYKPSDDLENFLSICYNRDYKLIGCGKNWYYLVLYYNCGNLQEIIDKKILFSESQVADFIVQIGRQLTRLHECAFYHGELCPEHICLNKKDGKIEYKICGFGRYILNKSEKHFENPLLKPYLDPRIIEDPFKEHSASTDIWSLGIIVYKLVTGNFPNINSKSMKETAYEYLNPVPGINLPIKLNHFVSR